MADVLSRSFEEMEEGDIIFSSNSVGSPGSLLSLSQPIYSILDELKIENNTNPSSKALITRYYEGKGTTGFIVRKGTLLYNNRYYLNEDSALIKKFLYEYHDSQFGGHAGIHRTWKRISKKNLLA